MDGQIILVLCLTFVIHLIATLAYSVRIVGTRTGRIVIAFSLFNLVALVARTANALQMPLLAKYIERQIASGTASGLAADLRWILAATTAATAAGIVLMPTFQRSFSTVVQAFNVYRSVPQLLVHGFSKAGVSHLRTAVAIPSANSLAGWKTARSFPLHVMLLNTLIEAVLTVGVLASLYAGYLNPALRVTASSLAGAVTGLATVLLFVFVDPSLSMLTDDVLQGKRSPLLLKYGVALLVSSRLAGTVLAQLLLVPVASVIATIANAL